MDAANVDLKAFTEDFYFQQTGAHLAPVLETLEYLVHETGCWLEITTLLIPGQNDSDAELEAMTRWVAEHLGPDVPLHFTAFHPDYKMTDVPATPPATLARARRIALAQRPALRLHRQRARPRGRHHRLPRLRRAADRARLVRGARYELDAGGACPHCGTALAGRFGAAAGGFGRRRIPVRVAMR